MNIISLKSRNANAVISGGLSEMNPQQRKVFFRQNLSPHFLPFYDSLCVMLPICWNPYSGYRSFEEQDALYAQGRTTPGDIVTNAKGGESAHNYGCATDWTWFDEQGQLHWLEDKDSRWGQFWSAIDDIPQLYSGRFFSDLDHVELRLDIPWKSIKLLTQDAAQYDNIISSHKIHINP